MGCDLSGQDNGQHWRSLGRTNGVPREFVVGNAVMMVLSNDFQFKHDDTHTHTNTQTQLFTERICLRQGFASLQHGQTWPDMARHGQTWPDMTRVMC